MRLFFLRKCLTAALTLTFSSKTRTLGRNTLNECELKLKNKYFSLTRKYISYGLGQTNYVLSFLEFRNT